VPASPSIVIAQPVVILMRAGTRTGWRAPASKWTSRALVLAALALVEQGCQRETNPELLEVNHLSSSEVQFGDTLQVSGDGFALGKPVLVHFRGELHRAGVAARTVNIALSAQAESQQELQLPLPTEAEREFYGNEAGEEVSGAHATFRGDLQVAIAASEPGAPPVTGTLHGATLELYPALEARTASERRAALGRRALGFWGVEVTLAPETGLTITATTPDGRAAAAGLEPGDRIVRAGGLSVREPSDLVPGTGRTLQLGVYRGKLPRSVLLDADGFHAQPPPELRSVLLLLSVVAVLFALWASPLVRLWTVLTSQWLTPLRARYGEALRATRASTALARVTRGSTPGSLVWLGVGAALLAPALRRTQLDLGLGLLALAFGSALLSITASLVEGGRGGPYWSLRRGVRAALQQFLMISPVWIGLLSLGLESGVDADEWVKSQGAWPWTWNALSSPGLSLSFLLMLLSALPEPAAPRGRLHHARAERGNGPAGSLLGTIYACSVCALGALAFLGGGAGFGAEGQAGEAASRLLPSLVCFMKYACLYAALSSARRACQRLTLAQWAPMGLWLALPGSLVAVVLTQTWRSLDARSSFWHWLLSGFGPLLTAVSLVLLAAAGWGIAQALRRPAPYPGLSPWL
jgi:NADH-quinone oxidoreductase subunit H